MLSHGQDRQDVDPLVDARCPGLGDGVHDGRGGRRAVRQSIAEIDEAAATGVIPAKYQGWQLLVDIDVEPPKKPTKKAAAPKKTAAKR